jgi:membrane protein involved in colicin uptake
MTRRQESADSMIGFVQAVPAAGQVAGDLIAKAQDWPDADQIAERLKRIIPPQVLGDEADNDKSPEEIAQQRQQAEQAQALQQQAAELEMQAKQAATRKTLAEADRAEAEALKARAEAEKAEVEAQAARAEALIAGAHMAETAANDIPSGDMAA